MCGIVAAIAERNVVPILLEGLKSLEYRGYDSAGLAVIDALGKPAVARKAGKVKALASCVAEQNIHGQIGIAHTRWATHGLALEKNAHPQVSQNKIAVVHNGIIENYQAIKLDLNNAGIAFQSDTDSEVIAASVYKKTTEGLSLLQAVQEVIKVLKGSYAICVLDLDNPERLVLARCGSPLVIGLGVGEFFVASDVIALQRVTQEFMFLEDEDLAEIKLSGIKIVDFSGQEAKREVTSKKINQQPLEKGKYRHFMQKEIFEQPKAVAATMENRLSDTQVLEAAFGHGASEVFAKTRHIQILACGTSYYAGLIARNWLEEIAHISCQVDIASEFRYRNRILPDGTLIVTISQSGETADLLAALKHCCQQDHEKCCGTLSICNVAESSLVRASQLVCLTHAGPEIGVASTKAFLTQLVALFMLTLVMGKRTKILGQETKKYINDLKNLPDLVESFLSLDQKIKQLANNFADKRGALFLGRGMHYPTALEGALKLKEISYIHAEAYPAGELKHGPLALVDKNMPVVVLASNDQLLDKIKSNIQEVRARGGQILVIAPKAAKIKETGVQVLEVPEAPIWLVPLLYAIPLQLLAYHVAVLKGTDVDQPRNLAKSVTVE